MSKVRHILFFGGLFIFFSSLSPILQKGTGNFSLQRIQWKFSDNPALECGSLSEEKKQEIAYILSQPFRYLSRGGQCFVFASEDGKYVIKFFRQRTFKWKAQKQQAKYQNYFASAALAFRKLKEESALLWVHLNKTPTHPKSLKIFDKLGIVHNVDLQNTIFVLQRKGIPSVDHLQALSNNNAIEQARQGVIAMTALLVKRCEEGIYDEDAELHKNMGFLDTKPIFIDIGRFRKMNELENREEREANVAKTLEAFYHWIAKHRPELSAALETNHSHT
jgi:hypothetical protein